MAINKGYLTCNRTSEGDEVLTPRYAVLPILKYVLMKGYKTVWCPFSLPSSKYVKVFQDAGLTVIHGHIDEGKDFFKQDVPECDCIIDNPPFSKKDKILTKLYEIGKPFALLLPQNSLQSKLRTSLFIKYGLEYLGFDKRICFYTRSKDKKDEYHFTEADLAHVKFSNHFASGYFCYKMLPDKMILETLTEMDEPYNDSTN